jgi:hypothetical protein
VITLNMLLEMRSGLGWTEEGVFLVSLFSEIDGGNAGSVQASQPLIAEPGSTFEYSSGSSALAARVLGDAIGREDFGRWIEDRLFSPLDVDVELLYDADGYWAGGLGANMGAYDYARLGLLYLRGGQWDRQQIVAARWIDDARRSTVAGCEYGSGPWIGAYGPGSFSAEGYLGQNIVMIPDRDMVVVVLASESDGELVDEFTRTLVDHFR